VRLFDEALLEGEAEMIVRNVIKGATDGDPVSVRLCLDRLAPRLRQSAEPIAFSLPPINTPADALAALSAIAAAVATGELNSAQADELSRFVHRWVQAVEAVEFERRLKAVEDNTRENSAPYDS
jgi:hypothetical protein